MFNCKVNLGVTRNKQRGVLFPVPLEFKLDDTYESTVEIHASCNSVLYSAAYTLAPIVD